VLFPVYRDRFPIQMLSFLRLSRVQDSAELAKITFEGDSIVSQLNEYEVLQLVMGEMRDRLSEYIDNQVSFALI
jgi:protein-histidine N-methyltransferase